MRLLSVFCGEKAFNGNIKHFVFGLTCDVIGDPEVIKICFPWIIIPGLLTRARVAVSATFAMVGGGQNDPPSNSKTRKARPGDTAIDSS